VYAFITLGISSFVAWRYYAHVAATREIQQSIANNMVAVTAEHQAYVMGSPQRIIIPGLVINLPIVAGNYDKEAQEWSLSNTSANFATNTNNPNNKGGKTLIYGHALASIFGKLNKLSSEDTVYIVTNNGHTLSYKMKSVEIVPPTDTSVFDKMGGTPGLYLVTCDGTWSTNRRIISLDLMEVS